MGKAVRLDRFLADSGAGTRTEVKKLIQKGMVQVNGEKAKKPELKIDPETDVVEFDGEHIGARAEFVYYLLCPAAVFIAISECLAGAGFPWFCLYWFPYWRSCRMFFARFCSS